MATINQFSYSPTELISDFNKDNERVTGEGNAKGIIAFRSVKTENIIPLIGDDGTTTIPVKPEGNWFQLAFFPFTGESPPIIPSDAEELFRDKLAVDLTDPKAKALVLRRIISTIENNGDTSKPVDWNFGVDPANLKVTQNITGGRRRRSKAMRRSNRSKSNKRRR